LEFKFIIIIKYYNNFPIIAYYFLILILIDDFDKNLSINNKDKFFNLNFIIN